MNKFRCINENLRIPINQFIFIQERKIRDFIQFELEIYIKRSVDKNNELLKVAFLRDNLDNYLRSGFFNFSKYNKIRNL